MQALKYETVVHADHRLSIDLPPSFPVGEAEVIVMSKSEPQPPNASSESLLQLLDWLNTLPPTGRTKEEIEAQIAEERNSWGD